MKKISLLEFSAKGYLQEVNRQFLHPLGLALAISIDDDGTCALHGVLDARDDGEGFYFSDEVINTPEAEIKRAFVAEERERFRKLRISNLGFAIQSVRPRGRANDI